VSDARPLPSLPDVLILVGRVHRDARGFFTERWRRSDFTALGLPDLVQLNQSRSRRHVLRGLHFQRPPHGQGKLVTVVSGAIFDVVVDVREGSATFGQWASVTLSSRRPLQLWVPAGFAHGFLVLSRSADVLYATDAEYAPAAETGVRWDDPELAIPWPIPSGAAPILSAKDAALPSLADLRSA
jgi:dTDP-4-dehydrorhamnose 3,5-epimerase